MKTLMIVDDHPIVLEGLAHVLGTAGYNVIKTTSAVQALQIVRGPETVDMYVIDLCLHEGTDGLDLLHDLRACGFDRPAVIYTMHEELWCIAQLVETDVEGIVLKGEEISELTDAVRIVSDGGRYRSPVFAERYDTVMHTRGILSAKDIEVLRRMSRGETSREIAAYMKLVEKTIEYHRSNILKKLGCRNMTEAISKAMRLGIIT